MYVVVKDKSPGAGSTGRCSDCRGSVDTFRATVLWDGVFWQLAGVIR